MSELKQEFEQWATSHGDLLLEPSNDGTCENGWFPATYHSAMTEIAWRAFANRRPSNAASAQAADRVDADRYRVLRDLDYQLHEDDIAVSDSFFTQYFGAELDKAVDELKQRRDALQAKQSEVDRG